MTKLLFTVIFLGLSGCGLGPIITAQDVSNLNSIIQNDGIRARTVVISKGETNNSSCTGMLCGAFGVESVSSSINVSFQMQIDMENTPEAQEIIRRQAYVFVAVEPSLKFTQRRSGRIVVSDRVLRYSGSIACANEPWMYVLSPENGYSIRLDGIAEVTLKRSYSSGSSFESFETLDVDGAVSPVIRASFEAFRPNKHNCWHRTFDHLRP